MSNSEIVTVIIAIIGSSAFTGLLIHLLNRRKTEAETKKVLAEARKIGVEADIITKGIVDKVSEKIELYFPGKYYEDYFRTFEALEDSIGGYIRTKNEESNGHVIVPLKLLAVAMTFSWDTFITHTIPRILKRYPNVIINLDLLYVSHEYLKQLNISTYGRDWVKESERRDDDVKAFCQEIRRNMNRLHINARVYRSLPQWHGWLVGENHLFLGRTRWFYNENELPILSVGQNEYRYFNNVAEENKQRIDLYLSWFWFHFNHQSEQVDNTG